MKIQEVTVALLLSHLFLLQTFKKSKFTLKMTFVCSWCFDKNSLNSKIFENNKSETELCDSSKDVYLLLGLVDKLQYFFLGTVLLEKSMYFALGV